MQNTLPLLGSCIVLIITSACGPLVPLSYVRETSNVPMWQTIETEEATVTLEYVQSQYGHYIFDLEVINHSLKDVLIAPQFVSVYASPKLFKPLKDSTDVHLLSAPNSALKMDRQFANSPAATRKIYHEKVKSRETGAFLFALLGAGLAIYDATKDAEDSKKERWTKKDENKAIGRDLLVSAAFTASDVARASARQTLQNSYYVPYELFPECEIQSGATVRGKIFIPIESSYRYTRVVVPLRDIDYVFDFKRKGVKSTRSRSQHHP